MEAIEERDDPSIAAARREREARDRARSAQSARCSPLSSSTTCHACCAVHPETRRVGFRFNPKDIPGSTRPVLQHLPNLTHFVHLHTSPLTVEGCGAVVST